MYMELFDKQMQNIE